MKKIYNKLNLILILMLIWIALNESLSLRTIVSGAIFASISVFLTYYLLSDKDNVITYYIPLWFLIFYLFAMFYFIIKASIEVLINLIKGKKNPKVVKIKSKLKNPWYTSIVANSITLTPGTVTLDKTGDTMEVLYYLGSRDDAKENYEEIAGQFEKLFFLIDKKR